MDWNLISVPLIQIDTSRDHVHQTLEDNYTAVQAYHAGKSQPWLHWKRDKPDRLNDEIEINHSMSYYIYMSNPDYLVVAGRVPTTTQIPLKAGWNLVGYPRLINITMSDALSSIAGKYNAVFRFDPANGREVQVQAGDIMSPGNGYWIHATENCVWVI